MRGVFHESKRTLRLETLRVLLTSVLTYYFKATYKNSVISGFDTDAILPNY
jgi:hypothetical protein